MLVMGADQQEKETTVTVAFLRIKAYLKSKRTSTERQKNNPRKKENLKWAVKQQERYIIQGKADAEMRSANLPE